MLVKEKELQSGHKDVRGFTFLGSSNYSKVFFTKINCYRCWETLCYFTFTLRFLVTADSQTTIGTSCRISPATMGRIIYGQLSVRRALLKLLIQRRNSLLWSHQMIGHVNTTTLKPEQIHFGSLCKGPQT